MAELETLKAQWCKSLMEHVALGCPNAMKVQQDRVDRAQRITEYIDENNDLMLNPNKMRALRALLFG